MEIDSDSDQDSGRKGSSKVKKKQIKTTKNTAVFLPGTPMEEGEELVCDQSAYIMLHQAQTGYPCLSFDIIRDQLGNVRENFPLTSYIVAGTQAPRTHTNSVIIIKMSNMHKTQEKSESDEDISDSDSDTDDEPKQPKLSSVFISHKGCVNRVRAATYNNSVLAATWSELGQVNIWDIRRPLKELDEGSSLKSSCQMSPLFSFVGHQIEGFSLDWSPISVGVLASGDCRNGIHIWHPSEGDTWHVDQRPLQGHSASVEDLQWSPTEGNVLASCSVDKSIRIWDTRSAPNVANKLTISDAHTSDINVISWNKKEPLIVSGGDDGMLHVWDLRNFQPGSAVASFKHHTNSVTTVEWNPSEGSVFASGGADNQIALWDLAVERDAADEDDKEIKDLPPQLLFIHQGQTDLKELHWHPQLPGVIISTALSGFNIFRTISI